MITDFAAGYIKHNHRFVKRVFNRAGSHLLTNPKPCHIEWRKIRPLCQNGLDRLDIMGCVILTHIEERYDHLRSLTLSYCHQTGSAVLVRMAHKLLTYGPRHSFY